MTRRGPASARAVAALTVALGVLGTAWAQGVAGATPPRRLTVFAASSLTEAFEALARAFERARPGVRVELNFAGSATLATQIVEGAPADVFASADEARMGLVAAAGLARGAPRTFATNRLVVITPRDAGLATLADLALPGTRVVLAGPEVPVGAYGRTALRRLEGLLGAGFADAVLANVLSEEPNVRQAAAKVELGEADAALVYATDAAVLQRVRVLPLPEPANVRATYPIAALAEADAPELAAAFVAFVCAPAGQAILADHGFGAP